VNAPRLRFRPFVAAALLILAWGSLGVIDIVCDRIQQRAEAAAPLAPPPSPTLRMRKGRVFVLLIDSLRVQSALAVPAIRDLRPRALFVNINAVQAATVPSLRAAFTGQRQRSIFAFVLNFVHGTRTLPSLFTQLKAAGGRSAVFTDHSFYELAPGAADLHSNEDTPGDDEEARERTAFHEALNVWAGGEHRLVVFHYTTIDHTAHWHPVGDPVYRHAFQVADTLVREADAAVGPDDTLVVMGDHGHDAVGRHFPGINVPTLGIYRGPRFKAGAELGPQLLTIHRYLMSWALGLPLSNQYRGAGVPEVLVGPAPLPAAFLSPTPETSVTAPWRARLLWLAPLVLVIGFLTGGGEMALGARLAGSGARVVVVGAFVAAFFTAWGAFLSHRRITTRPPVTHEILEWWLLGLSLAIGLTMAGRRRVATWLALASPGLLLYASAAWYSWAAVMTPAWCVALVLLVLDWALRRGRAETREPVTGAEVLALATLPALAIMLLPFFYAETDGVVAGEWRGYLGSNRFTYWIAITAAAKLVIFARPRRGVLANVVAVGLVAVFTSISFGNFLPSSPSKLAAAAFLACGTFLARGIADFAASRGRSSVTASALASVLGTAALLMLYRATVVLEERSFLEMEILLAALCLTSWMGQALGRAEDRAWFANWLDVMAVLVAAWTTLALTLHRLEWAILYRFLEPTAVMVHVGWLLPIILGRYAIPLVVARRLLTDTRPPGSPSTWWAVCATLMTKLATLVLMTVGCAVLDPTNEPFRSVIQNVVTLSVLSLALIFEPRRVA